MNKYFLRARKAIFYFLYCGVAYAWTERPFPWAVGPHPRWANRIVEFLYYQWQKEGWDKR